MKSLEINLTTKEMDDFLNNVDFNQLIVKYDLLASKVTTTLTQNNDVLLKTNRPTEIPFNSQSQPSSIKKSN
ncbi:hypothetical protein [Lactiplantibacillus songbeiensis]|uniref:Uncharacterized protein n=1 Tax=Lactiplantibacillus songbeiensis TaxID=2559920 RepID=A0ABW4C2M6_9LACO|nr:hypothetical protein [Lactiplantibacillus songbeiensis]